MAHGGSRSGAGRKPGATTKMNEAARAKALEGGISPLEYMLDILRDPKRDDGLRFEAAKAAAPYVHAKLAAVEHSGPDGGPVQLEKIERVIVDPQNRDP